MPRRILSCGVLIAILICQTARFAPGQSDNVPGKTAFKIDPLTALKSPLLATPETEISATELDLLNQARHNTMNHFSMGRAALVISGVTDEDEQKPYLRKLAEIAAGCKEATADAEKPLAKAKALGKYLIQNPLSAGYDKLSFRLQTLLDTGHYNCVSSAVLYSIMADKCGLEVRTVTKSGHVFLRALDFDIEPTNGHAYSIGDRNDRILAEQVKKGERPGPAYATFPYRETNRFGLLSTIYQDEAGQYGLDKKYEATVSTYLKAACLDPKDPSTLSNIRKWLKSWSKASKADHQDAKAAKIDAFANSLLRDPSVPNKTRAL